MRSEGSSRLRRISRRKLHMRGSWCQASIALPKQKVAPAASLVSGQPSRSFLLRSTAPCRPCGVVGDALASSKRSGKSTGFLLPPTPGGSPESAFSDQDCRTAMTVSFRCVAIRGSSPLIDCGFDARRTSHPVAGPERLAPQSLILRVIGLGRAGPHCMSAYHSHCL